MSGKKLNLSREEIANAFQGERLEGSRAILSPMQLAKHLALSVKTVYEWLSKGRLDGAFRKRGKHCLIWRDRAIDILFNGKDWTNERETGSDARG